MKKTLVAVGAAATSFVLGVVPAVAPVVNVANVYAATGETTVEGARAKVAELKEKILKQYPDIEAYAWLSGYVMSIYAEYACTGKGCAVDTYTDPDTGERVDPKARLNAVLTAAGYNPESMDTFERLEALKKTDAYKNDAKVKSWVDGVESDINGITFGYEGLEDYSILGNLPSVLNKDELAKKTAREVFATIEALPHIDAYLSLGQAYSNLSYMQDVSELAAIDKAYDLAEKTLNELNAVIAKDDEPETPATPEQTAAEKELSDFVTTTRNNPLFQKYERLVNAVRNARALYLEIIEAKANEENTDPVPVERGAATPAAQAEEGGMGAAEDDYAEELVGAIREIGDALRDLGIENDLGKKEVVTVDDLKGAFERAEKIENYQSYADLVDAVYAAELALSEGNVEAGTLKEILTTVKAAAEKVFPPDTGVTPTADYEASATAGFPAAAIVATLAATVGAAVVLKRRFSANKAE